MANEITIYKRDHFKPIKEDWLATTGLKQHDFMKEVGFALQMINSNKMLAQCSAPSLQKAVLNTALTGLSLNPVMKYAYLIPRYITNRGFEAFLEPSYVGLVKLLTDAGMVSSMTANVIYSNDDYEIDLASDKKIIKHIPHYFKSIISGDRIAVYSIATLKSGERHVEIMSAAMIEDIKEYSESYKAYKKNLEKGTKIRCVWVDNEDEMWRKTVIKRHYKYLPKSSDDERVANAIALDNMINGFREEARANYRDYLQSLLNKSTLDSNEKEMIEGQIESAKYNDELDDIKKIIEPTIDEIQQDDYSMGGIKKKVDRAVELDDARDSDKLF